jgi:MFS family permease
MGLGGFIATFDITAVALVLSDIGRQFSLDVDGSVWIMNGYSLALTMMLITAGAISDRYGHRLSVIVGAALFLVASASCAFAPGYGVLIAGRVVQGIGAAFIVCGGLALVGQLYTEKTERVKAFGIIGTIQGASLAVGPGLGGIIATELGWEWIFLINLPVCVVIIAGAMVGMTERRNRQEHALDVVGLVLFSLILLIATWLLSFGPRAGGTTFNAPTVVVVLGVLCVVFVWHERRVPRPALDLALFRRKGFVGLAIVPLVLAISYWSLMVYIPLFFLTSLRLATEPASYVMLFFTVPMFVIPYLVTGIAARARHSRFFPGGLAVVAAGCLVLALGAYLGDLTVAIVGMVVAGVGAATVQNQVSGALIASAPEDRAGAVAAVMTVLRQGGFAVGSALLSNAVTGSSSADGFVVLFMICVLVAGVGAALTFLLIRSDEKGVTGG